MRYLRRLWFWIGQNLPAQCPTCQQWQAKKYMKSAPHRTDWIDICSVCFRNLYPGIDPMNAQYPNPHSPTYRITPAQIAQAAQAQTDFAAILASDPTAQAPVSFRQMILNEAHGWTWNIETGEYENLDANPDRAYRILRKSFEKSGIRWKKLFDESGLFEENK